MPVVFCCSPAGQAEQTREPPLRWRLFVPLRLRRPAAWMTPLLLAGSALWPAASRAQPGAPAPVVSAGGNASSQKLVQTGSQDQAESGHAQENQAFSIRIEAPQDIRDLVDRFLDLKRYQQVLDLTAGLGQNMQPTSMPGYGVVVIRGSDGLLTISNNLISSTRRTGVGVYEINFREAFTGSTDYAVGATCDDGYVEIDTASSTASKLVLNCFSNAGVAIDPARVRVMIHGVLT